MKKNKNKPVAIERVKNVFRFIAGSYVKSDFQGNKYYVHKEIQKTLDQKISNLLVISKLLGYELKFESYPVYQKNGKLIDSHYAKYRFHRPYDINEGVHIEFKFGIDKSLMRIWVNNIGQSGIHTDLDRYATRESDLECLEKALEWLK